MKDKKQKVFNIHIEKLIENINISVENLSEDDILKERNKVKSNIVEIELANFSELFKQIKCSI